MSKENQEKFKVDEDKPIDWFETLYANSDTSGDGVPWANMDTHPALANWLKKNALDGTEQKALVVGCGMGDDAIALERLGFQVTAFDVSDTAIELCKKRFPNSKVRFIQADLLENQSQWLRQYNFVLEIYTVQALPPKYEQQLIQNISSFVADEGRLLVVAEVSYEERRLENGPPWVLTPEHVDSFTACGMTLIQQDIEVATEVFATETYISCFSRQ